MVTMNTELVKQKQEWQERVEQYMPLARGCWKKMISKIGTLFSSSESDDLLQAAYLGLITAAQRFEPSKNVPFIAYARFRINGEILDTHRKTCSEWAGVTRWEYEKLGLDTPSDKNVTYRAIELGKDRRYQRASKSYLDALSKSRPDELAEQSEMVELALKWMKQLPERSRRVIEARFFDDKFLHEIGEEFGVTESRVCQIQNSALKFLREKLTQQPIPE